MTLKLRKVYSSWHKWLQLNREYDSARSERSYFNTAQDKRTALSQDEIYVSVVTLKMVKGHQTWYSHQNWYSRVTPAMSDHNPKLQTFLNGIQCGLCSCGKMGLIYYFWDCCFSRNIIDTLRALRSTAASPFTYNLSDSGQSHSHISPSTSKNKKHLWFWHKYNAVNEQGISV